jgi:hypothetical protein
MGFNFRWQELHQLQIVIDKRRKILMATLQSTTEDEHLNSTA